MKKLLIFTWIFMAACVTLSKFTEEGHVLASVSEYDVIPVANEVLLKRLYPNLKHSDCGLADEDFKKYVRDRVDFSRKFQFIVFVEGTTMTGKRCLRRAFIYYLKEKDVS